MRKILIVDDEPVNCRLLKELLDGKAFCDTVFSGKDAVDIFEVAFRTRNNYDLILLDIAMPEMDGLEVLDRIRKFEEINGIKLGTGVPVIILTAVKDAFMTAFKKGAEDYMLKPISRETLFEKIDEQLGKKAIKIDL
ncbi:MAG: response regulator [Candidatus Riflebacteria bacterium]|nr:response regulator [Candidatus Riflebacteria bacterium]